MRRSWAEKKHAARKTRLAGTKTAVVRELQTRLRGRIDPDAEDLQGRVRCVGLSKFNIMAFKGCKLTDDMIQFSLLKGHCGGKNKDDCSCFIAKAEMRPKLEVISWGLLIFLVRNDYSMAWSISSCACQSPNQPPRSSSWVSHAGVVPENNQQG